VTRTRSVAKVLRSGDLGEILTLPPPEESALERASGRQRFDIATHSFRLWMAVVTEVPNEQLPRMGEGSGASSSTVTEVRDRLALILGAYYDASLRSVLMTSLPKDERLPPGLTIGITKRLFPHGITANVSVEDAWARFLPTYYVTAIQSVYFFSVVSGLPLRVPAAAFEDVAHGSLSDLFQLQIVAATPVRQQLAERLVRGCLSYMQHVYGDMARADSWKERTIGPFSSIDLPLFVALACRDPRTVERFGKNSAGVFEQQLALIIQSLGFYVVSTRPGNRTVDIVCVSSDPTDPFTALVEAKTSTRPYALPADDERALREYVADVRRNLTTLPPLRFVLVVSAAPGRTLEPRLRRLEAALGVPTRFCTAQLIANLRESLPGPAPFSVLSDEIVLSPPVLEAGFVDKVASRYREIAGAHEEFVRALLGSQKVPSR
jgi:hypothetical protein